LFFPQLVERLAIDAKRGRRSCLEALQADFYAAGVAIANQTLKSRASHGRDKVRKDDDA